MQSAHYLRGRVRLTGSIFQIRQSCLELAIPSRNIPCISNSLPCKKFSQDLYPCLAIRACRAPGFTPRKAYSTKSSNSPASPPNNSRTSWSIAGLTITLVASVAVVAFHNSNSELLADAPFGADFIVRKERKNIWRLDEIRQHGAEAERPWIIKGTGVYDITDWIPTHPGGKIILRAAGSSIEPYWDIFSIHKREDVYQILEQYRIGDVDPQDLIDGQVPHDSIDDPFRDDPKRDPGLVVLTPRPCNAETPPAALSSFITKTPFFYIRHHFWVPHIDETSWQMTIDIGDGSDAKTYTLNDLRTKFPQYSITAVVQCSGNRRTHMSEGSHREASGLKWDVGAISNAEWRGPLLRDVLRDAGLDLNRLPEELRHAQFLSEDSYGTSIPLDKAIDPRGDVILACEMNNEALPPDHGYPVRVIVPGFTGARNVKWVNRITLSDEESPSQWQQRDYKCFGPNELREKVDWDRAPAIQETPVQSAITAIQNDPESIVVEGYAFSGGGRRIIRVDVSVDNGQTWEQAQIEPHKQHGHKTWSWSLWKYRCPRPPAGSFVVVKAVDEAYNVQPDTHGPTWNFRGNLVNAWHRVRVEDLIRGDNLKGTERA